MSLRHTTKNENVARSHNFQRSAVGGRIYYWGTFSAARNRSITSSICSSVKFS
jgi:hypothetical protein